MKKILFSIVFLIVAQVSFAQDSFKADIKKYMELSGQMKTFELLTTQLTENVPEAKKAEFTKELNASINVLQDKMADMYTTEFTPQDVKEMIKFYESPIGRKLSSKTDILFEKGQAVGEEWGMGLQGLMMKYMGE